MKVAILCRWLRKDFVGSYVGSVSEKSGVLVEVTQDSMGQILLACQEELASWEEARFQIEKVRKALIRCIGGGDYETRILDDKDEGFISLEDYAAKRDRELRRLRQRIEHLDEALDNLYNTHPFSGSLH